MKVKLALAVLMAASLSTAYAEKPEWAGQGQPTAEQKAAHRAAMEAKIDDDAAEYARESKERADKMHRQAAGNVESGRAVVEAIEAEGSAAATEASGRLEREARGHESGLDKQRAEKSELARKELDKGSDTGKAARAEHSRKWWRFWE